MWWAREKGWRREFQAWIAVNGKYRLVAFGQASEKIKLQGGFDEIRFFSGFYLHMYQGSESKV